MTKVSIKKRLEVLELSHREQTKKEQCRTAKFLDEMSDNEIIDSIRTIKAQYQAEEDNPSIIADREADLHERGLDWRIEMEREMREEYYLGRYPSYIHDFAEPARKKENM